MDYINRVSEQVRAKRRHTAHLDVMVKVNKEARDKAATVSPTNYEHILGVLLRPHVKLEAA